MPAKTKRSTFFRNILIFLSILGPGIITGSVDNDVGGIYTYSAAGAQFGYSLIWTLIPAAIVLFVVQEMNARMGIVTGKGLADLIRENAGVRTTFVIFIFLLIADIMNTTTEFAGVSGSTEIFGMSKYITVPLTAFIIWLIVVKGNYKSAEKIFLIFSLALLVYIVAAIMAKPDWASLGSSIIHPKMKFDFPTVSTVIGLIGTTIAPWMQFYMQSSVIEKGLKLKDYKYTIVDIISGCVATIVVAMFIMVACGSTIYRSGGNVVLNDAKDVALALQPLAGKLAMQVFAFGLFIASIFSATILPVATAFYVCEAFGFEAGIDKTRKEAPQFYWLYTVIVIIGAGIVLLPGAPVFAIALWSQRINGILLPVVLICMILIINKKDVMGKYINRPVQNIICWVTVTVLVGLSLVLLVTSLI